MAFVKKLLRYLVFGCGLGTIMLFLSFFAESFGYVQGTPDWLIWLAFALGLLLGYFAFSHFEKAKGTKKTVLFYFGALAFTFFGAMIGFVVGATLGGNGLWVMAWGGLQGYESAGLLLGIAGSTLAPVLAVLVFSDKRINVLGTVFAGLIGGGLALLLTMNAAWRTDFLVFFLPIIFVVFYDQYQRRSRPRSGR